MSKAFDGIREGLEEAFAVARGEAAPYKMHVPAEIDVRAIRLKTGLTQEDFASAFGFTLVQIRDWEQKRSRPLQAHRAYMLVIDSSPDDVRQMLRTAMVNKARRAA